MGGGQRAEHEKSQNSLGNKPRKKQALMAKKQEKKKTNAGETEGWRRDKWIPTSNGNRSQKQLIKRGTCISGIPM